MLKRVIVAVLLIALLAAVLHFGGWFQLAAITLAAMLSVYELRHAMAKNDRKLFDLPAYIFTLGFYIVYKLDGLMSVFLLWTAALMIVCAERVLNKNRGTLDSLLSLALLVYPAIFYVALMLIAEYGDFDKSRLMLLSAFAMPLMGDTFAMFSGKLFGKKKLCPDISPNKTVAGSVGGILGGVAGGALAYLAQWLFYSTTATLSELMALGFVAGILGQIGDLFASAIKRYAGVKDYGSIFPGHGGMTDRLDSVLYCAPIIYAAFTLWPH